jgi:hypothetical protein
VKGEKNEETRKRGRKGKKRRKKDRKNRRKDRPARKENLSSKLAHLTLIILSFFGSAPFPASREKAPQ